MKNLFFILIASIALTSCSEPIIKDVNVKVINNTPNTQHLTFAIHADYMGDFGVNYQDFVLEVIVTATCIGKPTITQMVILTQDNFIACNGVMVHGLGYRFDAITLPSNQSGYVLSHTKKML